MALLVARASAAIASGFVSVTLSMVLPGLLLAWLGEETHTAQSG
jgi:hypothetical protein